MYGPRQEDSVIIKTLKRIQNNQTPLVKGDGGQIFDYVYIDDVIEATISAMTQDCSGEVFNVGSSVGMKIKDVIRIICDVHDKNVVPMNEPADQTSNTARVADIAKIKRELGWIPKTDFRKGIQEISQWAKQSKF